MFTGSVFVVQRDSEIRCRSTSECTSRVHTGDGMMEELQKGDDGVDVVMAALQLVSVLCMCVCCVDLDVYLLSAHVLSSTIRFTS